MDIESNFDFLIKHSQLLAQLAQTAEASFVSDPNTTMAKLRQLTEALAKNVAARVGIDVDHQSKQFDLLNDINLKIDLDRNVLDAFNEIRKLGNQASNDFTSNTHRDAKKVLKVPWMISRWFHITFGDDKAKGFR